MNYRRQYYKCNWCGDRCVVCKIGEGPKCCLYGEGGFEWEKTDRDTFFLAAGMNKRIKRNYEGGAK